MTGAVSYHGGQAAEDSVARVYVERGLRECARRWRGRSGEIDLVFADGDAFVFVEVKSARTHALAMQRLSARQLDRICTAATEFVAGEPLGQDTPMRIDLAVVDHLGMPEIHENILM